MPVAYSVTAYREQPEPARLAEYAALANPLLQAAGGRYLTRGFAAKAYELGTPDRTIIIEWPSVQTAAAFYESEGYQSALAKLGKVARDVRIIEGA